MNISSKLTDIYLTKENWHKVKLSREESDKYHKRLLMQGNILTIVEDGELKAYLEVWKITYDQLGRLMCGLPFYAFEENITKGNIAYINNGWVDENYRNDKVAEDLEDRFKNEFKDCKYIARKRFKYSEAFKIYPMSK